MLDNRRTARVRQSIEASGFSRYPESPKEACCLTHLIIWRSMKVCFRERLLSRPSRSGNPIRAPLERTAEGNGLCLGARRAWLQVQQGKSMPEHSHRATRASMSSTMPRLTRSFSGCLSKSKTIETPPLLAKLCARLPSPPYKDNKSFGLLLPTLGSTNKSD